MNKISNMRITVPFESTKELYRSRLIQTVKNSSAGCFYVHAGGGYGKTTLLAQLARTFEHSLWLTLAGERDVITLLHSLTEAAKRVFSGFDFSVLEFFGYRDREDFIHTVSNAFLDSMEHMNCGLTLFIDDLHTVHNKQIKELVSDFLKYSPSNIHFYFGSREALWGELSVFSLTGQVFILKQEDLAFTREETGLLLSLDSSAVDTIHSLTEGWPLAVHSFRILIDSGVSIQDIPSRNKETLHSYLSSEYMDHLPKEVSNFLSLSSCFDYMDADMLDTVLNIKQSKDILYNLVEQNIFTQENNGLYRYHALFRSFLRETADPQAHFLLLQKAASYYLDQKNYSNAGKYAILTDDKELLKSILLKSYREDLRWGNYSQLQQWFHFLGSKLDGGSVELLVAQGAYLSTIGKFTEAMACLDEAIPEISPDDTELSTQALLHKARVYRNCISFEASTALLKELATLTDNPASEAGYLICVEILYNYCWNSQINEAYQLVFECMETCSRTGNLKIRAWYERYLSAVYFFGGRMREAIHYYEKSLDLPEKEQNFLDTHGIGIYAAKAYQMMGKSEKALALLSQELNKMKENGKFEEMWSHYLFAAEIHYQEAFIDMRNGMDASFEETKKYFILADEAAPLYRKTAFQLNWSKMQRLTYSLIFTNEDKARTIRQLKLEEAGPYLKCIVLARLTGYFASIQDYSNAMKCAKHCIRTGEKVNMLLHPTVCYGALARGTLALQQEEKAKEYVETYLKLSYELGSYAYFQARTDYDPILQYAYEHGIEPEITKFMMDFAGYCSKKAYIGTFGGFCVLPYNDREKPLQMRTRKERELFAFLLSTGNRGATKEEIHEAIWSESQSENFKKLIGVNLCQLKKDLEILGLRDVIICEKKHYRVNTREIECDYELFEGLWEHCKNTGDPEDARKLVSLYKGEYLPDFKAIWPTARRLQYHEAYENALESLRKRTV